LYSNVSVISLKCVIHIVFSSLLLLSTPDSGIGLKCVIHIVFSSLLLSTPDSGIGLENGVFVTALVQGSPASREGSLTVGDRLIAVSPPPPHLIFLLFLLLFSNLYLHLHLI
jgi:hypothetical protein